MDELFSWALSVRLKPPYPLYEELYILKVQYWNYIVEFMKERNWNIMQTYDFSWLPVPFRNEF